MYVPPTLQQIHSLIFPRCPDTLGHLDSSPSSLPILGTIPRDSYLVPTDHKILPLHATLIQDHRSLPVRGQHLCIYLRVDLRGQYLLSELQRAGRSGYRGQMVAGEHHGTWCCCAYHNTAEAKADEE